MRIFEPFKTTFPVSIPITNPQASWVAPYVDMRRPDGDTYKLNVELSTDASTPTKVLIELLQDQSDIGRGLVSLAQKKVTLTNVATDYELEVPGSKVVLGRCSLSRLQVRVTPPIRVDCCFATDIPAVLTITSKLMRTGGVVECQNTTSLFWNSDTKSWRGTESDLCGCTIEYELYCNSLFTPSVWTLDRNIICPNATYPHWGLSPISVSCDPFELDFGSSCDKCCATPIGECGLMSVVTE